MTLLLAIRSTDPAGVNSPAAAASPTPLPMRDIAPPVEIFPLLPWQVALLIAGALLLVALLGGVFWWWLEHRPRAAPPPLPPRQVALAELERLRPRALLLSPYDFSIAVAGVLRTYVERQHGLRALRQTSPEFLASLAHAPQFSGEDRALLGNFLERCDLIQFARVAADQETNGALLESAVSFVQGGRR